MLQHDNTDRAAHVVLGLALGTAAGLLIGLLVAPRSGTETRGKIRGRALYARDQAHEKFESGRSKMADKLSHVAHKSKAVTDDLADAAKNAVDKTADRSKKIADQAS